MARAGEGPASVSGALACGLRDVLIDVASRRAVDAALDRLSSRDRDDWLRATPVGWVRRSPWLPARFAFVRLGQAT